MTLVLKRALTGLPLPALLVTLLAASLAQVSVAAPNPFDLLKGGAPLFGEEEQEFLDPDVAFTMTAEQVDDDQILTQWQIAPGYYLYREKFAFALVQPELGVGAEAASADARSPILLAQPQFPAGKIKTDEFFGEMEIYQSDMQIRLPLQTPRAKTAEPLLALSVSYQGCAEAGICYPPITKTIALVGALVGGVADGMAGALTGQVPGATADPVQGREAPATPQVKGSGVADVVSRQDQIAARLESGNWFLVISIFFGFGLALAFTPCVLPMVPILSGIIVGQGANLSTRSAFTLSLTYVIAMALMYALAGAVAGVFGHNLQAMFQDPVVLVGFSAVFVLLAFSMFGFYELQLPSSWQGKLAELSNTGGGGTYGGVAIMGALSAIIVGPCVAPPLAGALIYIGRSGDAALGGVALFSMALGMGAPLLVIGTSAGRWLPHVGAWMDAVKRVFGVILLGVAVWLLERILPGALVMGMWACLLIVSAVYLGAMESLTTGSGGWQRLWKGVGTVMLVYGVTLLVGAAGGGSDVFRPLDAYTGGGGVSEHQLTFERIKTTDDLHSRLANSSAPTMLDFYADWCVECKRMERRTFNDPRVQRALSGVTMLQADVTANDAEDQALLKSLGLIGPPAILFFLPNGAEHRGYRLAGYVDPARFASHVAAVVGQ
jgi:thiol:disulfide interchange protein DsbD